VVGQVLNLPRPSSCGCSHVCRRRRGEELQEYHPERVDLRALGHDPTPDVQRTGVADCARGSLHSVLGRVRQAGEAKVSHLGRAVLVQQDVWTFNVPVEHLGRRVMQMRQTASCV